MLLRHACAQCFEAPVLCLYYIPAREDGVILPIVPSDELCVDIYTYPELMQAYIRCSVGNRSSV